MMALAQPDNSNKLLVAVPTRSAAASFVRAASRPDPPPPSAAPSSAPALPASAPLQLDSAALERMRPYIGNAVEGISNVTGKTFVMTLKAGVARGQD